MRDLHDRIGATTIYVTHDQLEAMAMADRIAVMNHGVVEQIGAPQEIYDLPASLFVADFVGSPPMNFIPFEGAVRRGDKAVRIGSANVDVPEVHEEGQARSFVLGVRPEHVALADDAPIRGGVFGAEYLGTTQIVTVDIAQGQIKARLPSTMLGAARRNGRPRFQVAVARRCSKLRAAAPCAAPCMKAAVMAEVALRQVSKRFGEIEAVRELSLAIASGEFVVLLGPTGAGKTTTLRLVAGLERPDHGSVSIDGRDVTKEPPAARDVAFVFQQYSLYPHLTVYDNLAFPLRSPARRLPEAQIQERVQEVAELLRISHKLGNRATRLSGGEMQRVAIGRALVRRPAIYLMDEPLSSLDAKLRAELRLELKRIQANLGATVLYVTHDQIEAMTMATRIGVIRDGRLVQLGTPREIYESPCDLYVATRLGSPPINLLPAELIPEATPRGAATIGVRTEHLEVTKPTGADLVGRVRRVEHLGDQNHVHIEYQGAGSRDAGRPASPPLGGRGRGLVAGRILLYFDSAGRRIGVAAE